MGLGSIIRRSMENMRGSGEMEKGRDMGFQLTVLVIGMKECIRMIWKMVKEYSGMQMAKNTKELLLMEQGMDMVSTILQMETSTKDNGRMIFKMAKVNLQA